MFLSVSMALKNDTLSAREGSDMETLSPHFFFALLRRFSI
jgi:hypothetical protein